MQNTKSVTTSVNTSTWRKSLKRRSSPTSSSCQVASDPPLDRGPQNPTRNESRVDEDDVSISHTTLGGSANPDEVQDDAGTVDNYKECPAVRKWARVENDNVWHSATGFGDNNAGTRNGAPVNSGGLRVRRMIKRKRKQSKQHRSKLELVSASNSTRRTVVFSEDDEEETKEEARTTWSEIGAQYML